MFQKWNLYQRSSDWLGRLLNTYLVWLFISILVFGQLRLFGIVCKRHLYYRSCLGCRGFGFSHFVGFHYRFRFLNSEASAGWRTPNRVQYKGCPFWNLHISRTDCNSLNIHAAFPWRRAYVIIIDNLIYSNSKLRFSGLFGVLSSSLVQPEMSSGTMRRRLLLGPRALFLGFHRWARLLRLVDLLVTWGLEMAIEVARRRLGFGAWGCDVLASGGFRFVRWIMFGHHPNQVAELRLARLWPGFAISISASGPQRHRLPRWSLAPLLSSRYHQFRLHHPCHSRTC